MPRCSVSEGENAISHTNRNFVLAYIFLVALPIAGLVAILKSGRSLSAPYSVDGAWKIESRDSSSSACSNVLSAVAKAPLSISQSGKSLVVTVSGARTAMGTLEGKIIQAQFAGDATRVSDKSGTECGDGALTLSATLDPLTEPRTLSGTIALEGCNSCVPLEFRAARQPKAAGGTR